MTSGERILFVIEYLKVSKNKFSTKMLGLSASTKVDHIIKGRNEITPDFAKEICAVVPEISYNWLLKNEGDKFVKNHEKSKLENVASDSDINDLANTVVEYEDQLMEIPKIQKLVERHALIKLNEMLPEIIDRIYKAKSKSS
ncbi:hypothetical protein [Aquimarina algicola]|uniref:Helix-turn-helix transcriptional regulator n=1 Tax=Aquimarina algicola TaxID=2589995 RepID=A0A504JKM3_9FLAO|nr:hypothetical protein [Aquimarina algicola]TPN87091.1 hypothetical protein FHK87_05735 [Aquimarina algicola]